MSFCSHGAEGSPCLCVHVDEDDAAQLVRFTGRGSEYQLLCARCIDAEDAPLVGACRACLAERAGDMAFVDGVRGAPEVRVRASGLVLERREVALPAGIDLGAAVPEPLGERDWLAIDGGALVRFRLGDPATERVCALGAPTGLRVHAAPGGRFAAVVEQHGVRGVVVDLATGAVTMGLARGDYHTSNTDFSLAFVEDGTRTLVVHATDWNRLDMSDAATGALLTARELTRERELNYFHGGLTVSPDGRWLVDDGWVWHPSGCMQRVDVRRWLDDPWESDDGDSLAMLRSHDDIWDAPRCFADDRRLVTWGLGGELRWMPDAAVIIDVETGARVGWFAGPPQGRFAMDAGRLVVAAKSGTSVWDLATGERLLEVADFSPQAFHPGEGCHVAFRDGVATVGRLVDR